MKSLLFLLVVFICLVSSLGFSVNTPEISGDGKEETQPAKEGSTTSLRCSLSMSGDEEWDTCRWEHVLEDQYNQNNEQMTVRCTGLQISNGQTCTNHGGSHEMDQYAKRIKMDISPTTCGLTISNGLPGDSGEWTCTVSMGDQKQYSSLTFYASNHSKVRLSEPDVWKDPSAKLILDYQSTTPELRATCRGYGGSPKPTFKWFMNDDRHELKTNSYTSNGIREGTDEYGDYVSETISFKTDYPTLCRDYGLDTLCNNGGTFTFKFFCKTDQGTYYQRENQDAYSETLVEVRNAASIISGTFLTLLFTIFLVTELF